MRTKKKKHFTKTATFIFPLLGINKSKFVYDERTFSRVDIKSRFVNAFIYDDVCKKYNNHVSIVINSYRDVHFDNFYTDLSSHPTFVDSYEAHGVLVMVFEIPSERIDDFAKIVNGEYSKISPEGKQMILKNHYFDSQSSVIPMIFNKSKSLKTAWEDKIGAELGDNEVWTIMDESEETLTLEKLESVFMHKFLKPSKEFE
jgi:hypothetical protein